MMKKTFALLALATMTMTAQAGVVVTEGFDYVPGLAASGWLIVNQSAPPGATPGWYQGDESQFHAQAGANNAYAAANFSNADKGGTLDSWLVTPEFDATIGANISFYLRSKGPEDNNYIDQIAYGFTAGGAQTVVSPVPYGEWTKYSVFLDPGLVGTTRFAFHYFGAADTANYVGLDSVTVNVPEPASLALVFGGLLGLGAIRRRSRA
jgi:hypothetical protein